VRRGARGGEMVFKGRDICGGVSMSVCAVGGACVSGCGLDCGLDCDLDLRAFATLVRLPRRDLSLRNSALSSFNSFFSVLIFLSFFDIALPSPAGVQRPHRSAIRPANSENNMTAR